MYSSAPPFKRPKISGLGLGKFYFNDGWIAESRQKSRAKRFKVSLVKIHPSSLTVWSLAREVLKNDWHTERPIISVKQHSNIALIGLERGFVNNKFADCTSTFYRIIEKTNYSTVYFLKWFMKNRLIKVLNTMFYWGDIFSLTMTQYVRLVTRECTQKDR